jgi:HAE1 family hydrophobic/amphiphilic exporter-1
MQFLEAMIEAGRIRLRPILMTAVATITGATPIALGLGAGAASRRPLGYAVVGGLIFSTLLTLFLVPVVWTSFEAARERIHARRRTRAGQPAVAQPVATALSRAEAP